MTAEASDLVKAGQKYVSKHTPYAEMDCQAFIEQCLADIGVHKDWKGSNAMYRDMRAVMPVESAIVDFGSIPAGTFLFIWANDHGEIARGYDDGLGNASHVGFATGTPGDKGAMHSSQSKGEVCYSKFNNKSISGGWNYVGFCKLLDYGEKVEKILAEYDDEGETLMRDACIVAANGLPVNFRSSPKQANNNLIKKLPVGTPVLVLEDKGNGWYFIDVNGTVGYVMTEFVEMMPEIDEDEPEEEPITDTSNEALFKLLHSINEKLDRLCNEWENKMGGWG